MYLFVGLVLMLVLVANIYEVPELNLGQYFYMNSDLIEGEQRRLHTSAADEQARYTESIDKGYQKDILKAEDQRYL